MAEVITGIGAGRGDRPVRVVHVNSKSVSSPKPPVSMPHDVKSASHFLVTSQLSQNEKVSRHADTWRWPCTTRLSSTSARRHRLIVG